MPFPAIAAALARVLPMLGRAGATASRAGASAGRAGGKAASETSKVAQQVDDFNALFGEGSSGGGKGGGGGEGQRGGWGETGGVGQDIGDHVKGRVTQSVDNAIMGKITDKVDKAMKLLLDPIGTFAEKFERVSQNAESAVQNKFLPILIDILPPGFDKLAAATSSLITTFIDRGKELSQFSGKLTEANVKADLKSMMADMREAKEMEDPLARMTTSANEIWIEIRDAILPIKKFLSEQIAGFLERILGVIELVRAGVITVEEAIKTSIQVAYDLSQLEFTAAEKHMKELPDNIAAAIAKTKEDDADIDDLFKKMMDHPFGDLFPRDVQPNGNNGLGIPALT